MKNMSNSIFHFLAFLALILLPVLTLAAVESPYKTVVFFGDSAMKEMARDLPPEAINLAGITNLRELLCLIQDCDALVTNDSGPMHIAAAMGTPVVGLFGPTDPRVWGPPGHGHVMVHKGIDCRPCFPGGCRRGEESCMRSIGLEEVTLLVERMLERSLKGVERG